MAVDVDHFSLSCEKEEEVEIFHARTFDETC
jgi:hypothetical protein